MGNDEIEIEILPDGTLKITTDKISQANHRNADELMEFLAQKMGGPAEKQKKMPAIGRLRQAHQIKR